MKTNVFKRIIFIVSGLIALSPFVSFGVAQEFNSNSLLTDPSILAYHRLETDGTSTVGTIGNMSGSGVPTFPAAKFGNGASSSEASSQYLNVTSNLGVGGGDFSVCFWYKVGLQPDNAENDYLVFQGNNTSKTEFHIDYIGTAGTHDLNFVRTRRNVADDTLTTSQDLSAATFTHLCLTYDDDGAGTITGYVNGASQGTAASSGTGSGATTDNFGLAVNLRGTPGEFADGLFDDNVVFSRTLTPGEVSSIYDTAVAGGGGCNRKLRGVGVSRC